MKTRSNAQGARLCLESLESRYAPALLLGPNKLTYQDKDGDTVVVSFSKPILNFGDPMNIFTFDSGAGALNGSVSRPEQLKSINLTSIPVAASGIGINVTVTRSNLNRGNGFADIGEINATGIDLGAVTVRGDLGRIIAGDGLTTTPGLKSLAVQSLGRHGTTTGAPDLWSSIQGKLGALTVKGDVHHAYLNVFGNDNGDIGTLTIGGSLIGGSEAGSGVIQSTGNIGKVTIAGNIEGGTGVFTGVLDCGYNRLKPNDGAIGSLTLGGNLLGGSQSGTANLYYSGGILANHLKRLTIGGSLIAGTNATSGNFWANGTIMTVYEMGAITIKGSVLGSANSSAIITAGGQLLERGGKDLAIRSLTVKGHVEHGMILAGVGLIDKLTNLKSVDADAQIGSVTIGGDCFASSIAAGAVAGSIGFGTSADKKMSGDLVRDNPNISSSIGRVTIAGQMVGTAVGGDHFGIVAENIGKVKVNGLKVSLKVGNGNDDISIGLTGDCSVRELTA